VVDGPKSQEAISADITAVAAGERRDFRRLPQRVGGYSIATMT